MTRRLKGLDSQGRFPDALDEGNVELGMLDNIIIALFIIVISLIVINIVL